MTRACTAGLALAVVCAASVLGMGQTDAGVATQQAMRHTRPSIVIMDVASGRVLDQTSNNEQASLPGSALKPLVLSIALRSGAVREHDTIACRGNLTVGGHNLACSHPRDITVLDARQALASSCNTYFAEVARRIPSATLASGLRSFGLFLAREPRDADERILLALGLQGVTVTPLQLAQAYRRLAQQMDAAPSREERVIKDGLLASVQTGMANAARAQGVTLGGKTGTVDDPGGRSHGWFGGIVFTGPDATLADRIIMVYVPNGNGADAATAASAMLRSGAHR